MHILIRSIRVNIGQVEAAAQWSVDMCNYVNGVYPSVNLRVCREWLGDNGLVFIGEYDSLAHYEEISIALGSDEGYGSRIEDAAQRNLFVSGTLHDKMLEQF